MLDLDARIDLDEVELAGVGIQQEFHRAGAAIAGMPREAQGGFADGVAGCVIHVRGGRALDDFLVAALDGAVALPEMDEIAVAVAEDLDLDMAGAADQLFQIDLAIAEGAFRFAAAGLDLRLELVLILDHAHAAATTAPAGLEHQGIADFAGQFRPVFGAVRQRTCGGHHGNIGLNRHVAGGDLVAQGAHHIGGGADEGQAGRGTGLGEIGVFRQEAIAGMDQGGARLLGDGDDALDVQIGFHRPQTGPDPVAFIRLEPVEGELVLLGIDGHGLQAQLGRRAHDADGDFGPVGDKQLFRRLAVGQRGQLLLGGTGSLQMVPIP